MDSKLWVTKVAIPLRQCLHPAPSPPSLLFPPPHLTFKAPHTTQQLSRHHQPPPVSHPLQILPHLLTFPLFPPQVRLLLRLSPLPLCQRPLSTTLLHPHPLQGQSSLRRNLLVGVIPTASRLPGPQQHHPGHPLPLQMCFNLCLQRNLLKAKVWQQAVDLYPRNPLLPQQIPEQVHLDWT